VRSELDPLVDKLNDTQEYSSAIMFQLLLKTALSMYVNNA